MKFSALKHIIDGDISQLGNPNGRFTLIGFDTRKNLRADHLFVAIQSKQNDGHLYIPIAYQKGVRNFIVEKKMSWLDFPDANFFLTNQALSALQNLATHHRQQFTLPIIGITGSYGKTIIKEWLSLLLHNDFKLVKSPKSYNSQLGVPLSVWQIKEEHNLAIIEAGISTIGEMTRLEKIIKPTIGLFTNIGTAHSDGFSSIKEKIAEKLKLFQDCQSLVYCADHLEIHDGIQSLSEIQTKTNSWSLKGNGNFNYRIEKHEAVTNLFREDQRLAILPFTDNTSIENVLHCITLLDILQVDIENKQALFDQLNAIPLRLELKEGKDHSIIINDTYIADLSSLQIALEFQDEQNHQLPKVAILSEFDQSDSTGIDFNTKVVTHLQQHHISHIIGVGQSYSEHAELYAQLPTFTHYSNVNDFIKNINAIDLSSKNILVKGSRKSALDKVIPFIEEKTHQSTLEIDLNLLASNLKEFKSSLDPNTKVMAMVKALSYGAGTFEVAMMLQHSDIDYLTVAYVDEGVMLRERGITAPIMIMSPHVQSFGLLQQFQLEPEIFSMRMLKQLIGHVESSPLNELLKIHIKIDTGMNRLGFKLSELDEVLERLNQSDQILVASIFSHLSSADNSKEDDFTIVQINKFEKAYQQLTAQSSIKPIKHILNSAGIVRFPKYQFDMVRLGIGLYGIDITQQIQKQLHLVSTLKTHIVQLKMISSKDSIGYNRSGRTDRPIIIATASMGYADGISRKFGNGKIHVVVNGVACPTIGNICMDMFMIDVTEVAGVQENDAVIIFESAEQLNILSKVAETIPYEILTSISSRIKRVFIRN